MGFKVIVVFALFFGGGVIAYQGFIGKEIPPVQGPWRMMPYDPDNPGMEHPPERHPWRMVLIGVAVMVAAVLLGLVIL